MPNESEFDVDRATRELLVNDYRMFRNATLLLDSETNSLSVISLNELRNAIDHLAYAHDPKRGDNAEKEIQKAKSHLLRGVIDAKEAVIFAKIEKLRSLPLPVSQEVASLRQDVSDLEQKIVSAKIDGSSITEYLRLLDELDGAIIQAEMLLATYKSELEQAIRNERRGKFWRAVLWGAFGALLSAFVGYVASLIKF